MSVMKRSFVPLLLRGKEHPMHNWHTRSLIDTMKSLSPAAPTLKPLGIPSNRWSHWHHFITLCSLRVDIIRLSARPFCVLFSIFLELITQLKNRGHRMLRLWHYPIWSLLQNCWGQCDLARTRTFALVRSAIHPTQPPDLRNSLARQTYITPSEVRTYWLARAWSYSHKCLT